MSASSRVPAERTRTFEPEVRAIGGFFAWREMAPAPRSGPPSYSGYVEADYVMVTSALGGTVTTIAVTASPAPRAQNRSGGAL